MSQSLPKRDFRDRQVISDVSFRKAATSPIRRFPPVTDKIFPHPSSITALLISPFESDHDFMRRVFSHSSWTLYDATDVAQALPQLREGSIPVVLCSADPQRDSWKTILRETAEMQ